MKPDFVHIYSASGYLAGEMIRILLESMNIPVVCSQESVGATYGLTVGSLGAVKVFVPSARAEEARAILAAMEEDKLDDPIYPGLLPHYPQYKSNKMRPDEIIKPG